ncbi:uncharacterized protein [Sinocyclocheilus grahami]|uniref:uncharacterized protein n=1 Tax=Sinocyclocheilus grahami TaxID=75366 RepID=UPI0007AC80BE|nr:PREDICTED: uncharacterized protein LOC107564503 [Sinocyclocheilus grahami]
MSSHYYFGLPVEEKNCYLTKLKCDKVTLPDPFNKMLRQECFSTDLSDLPEVSQVHIFEYLVEKECVYTSEAFKAYHSLDAYNYFHSGKVKRILTYTNGNTCVVYGEVEAGQTLSKNYSAWIVARKFGEVQSGHCTCMAGNGEVCSHVGTILVTVEQCVQDGLQSGPSVTSKPSVWSRVTKKGSFFFGEQDAQGEEFNVFSSLAQPHSEHGSALSCPKCTTFYDAFIKLNPVQVVELERNTRKQSIELLWHDARKLRITASTASKVPQRETTDPVKFFNEHLYPKFQISVATRYGKESEGLAKEQIRERGCIVMDRGCWYMKMDTFVGKIFRKNEASISHYMVSLFKKVNQPRIFCYNFVTSTTTPDF